MGPSKSLGLLTCYCAETIQSSGLSAANILFPIRRQELCQDWLTAYGTSNGMMLAIVLFVSIAKIGISYLLVSLSKFERSHSVTAELASGTFKIFVAQFINAVNM